MHDVVVTAHAPLSLEGAQSQLLQWLEEAGLDVVYGDSGVVIATVDDEEFAPAAGGGLAVEVQLYPLGADWIQVRWSFRHGGEPAATSLALELAESLLGFLRADGRWEIDRILGAEDPG